MSRWADQEPIAQAAYDALAERYAAQTDDKPHNAHYERPATLALLPDVAGLRVLDAGCGPGFYTAWLAEHGATVLAVDANPKMVAFARQRVGSAAVVQRADLSKPLDFVGGAAIDLVLAPLVLDYIGDLKPLFAEFNRCLRPAGWFVFSMGHPFADFRFSKSGSYFDTELTSAEWRGFGGEPVTMPFYRRPLGAIFAALSETGFVVEQLVEPRPTPAFRQRDPKDYEKLNRQPGFICVRARKVC